MDPWDLISTAAQPAAAASGWDAISAPVETASGVTQGKTAPLRIQMGNPQPVSPGMDFLRSIPGGMVGGLSNALSAGGQAAQIEMGQPVDVPDAATTKSALEQNVTGRLPEPQGRAGKFGASVGEFVGNPASYIAPGSIPAKMGMAALAGLGSEAGGQLAEGTPYEGPARFLGAAAGAGAGAKAFQPGAVGATIGPKPSGSAPGVDALKGAASAGYESPEVAGVTLAAAPVAQKISGIAADLANEGIHPVLAPKTFGILNDAMSAPAGATVTVDNLRALRRSLGKAAGSIDPTERLAAKSAMQGVDKILGNMGQADVLTGDAATASGTLKEANANYSAAKHAELIDTKLVRAELRAAAASSGQNVANTIRQRMADILLSPKERRGFSRSELALMEKIVRGTVVQNMLRGTGNLLGGGGGMGAVVSAGAGAIATGGPGAVAPLVGYALKKFGNALTMRQVNQLSEMIRSRSPLGQAISNASADWEKARSVLVSGPSSAKFAAFSLASRNLANNLASAGIKVHPNQLLRAVQGPMDSSANEKKQ